MNLANFWVPKRFSVIPVPISNYNPTFFIIIENAYAPMQKFLSLKKVCLLCPQANFIKNSWTKR